METKEYLIDGLNIKETQVKRHYLPETETETEYLVTAKIEAAELDELNCEFHFDETVEINTKDFEFINLTIDNLKALIELIEKSERFFETKFNEEQKNIINSIKQRNDT